MDASPFKRKSAKFASLATGLRCGVVLLIAFGLRQNADQQQQSTDRPVNVSLVQKALPQATALRPFGDDGLWECLDDDQQQVGWVRETFPDAADQIGYRGPTNCLVVFDPDLTVQEVQLLESKDTQEHVDAILSDSGFWQQFCGLAIGTPSDRQVDAVSGATLTSLAIIGGIQKVLGQERPSLKFPQTLTAEEVQSAFDISVNNWQAESSAEARFSKDDGNVMSVVRTGPLSDQMIGYQGPTELLVLLDTDRTIQDVVVRSTYDNEPYSGYIDDEPWYWDSFRQQKWPSLSGFDLQEAGVEGVSGATMTSMAAVETLIAAAVSDQQNRKQQSRKTNEATPFVSWTYHDLGTLAIVLTGWVLAFSRLRGRKALVRIWRWLVIGYFGLTTGNLLSLATLSGWAESGVPWKLAPGLVSVFAVSVLACTVGRRNIYCSHLCPHGIVQQLLVKQAARKSTLRKQWKTLFSRLAWLPGITLFAATALLAIEWNTDLATWEPFHGWVWTVAGGMAISFTVATLIASAWIPMFYCRYACATGRLLDYIRNNSAAQKFLLVDACAFVLLVLVWT